MKYGEVKIGDRVKLGGVIGRVIKIFPVRQQQRCDQNMTPVGKPFMDFSMLIEYPNAKGRLIKNEWPGKLTKKCK